MNLEDIVKFRFRKNSADGGALSMRGMISFGLLLIVVFMSGVLLENHFDLTHKAATSGPQWVQGIAKSLQNPMDPRGSIKEALTTINDALSSCDARMEKLFMAQSDEFRRVETRISDACVDKVDLPDGLLEID